MNIQNLLNYSTKKLKQNLITSAMLDSENLLQKVIKKDRKFLILNPKKNIKTNKVKIFKTLVRRRQKGEPISYIINKKVEIKGDNITTKLKQKSSLKR